MEVVMREDSNADGHDNLCGAKKRQGDGWCRRPAGWGTSHVGIGRCRLHGGSTPTHVVAADKTALEVTAHRLLALEGAPPVTDPLRALAALAGDSVALVNALRGFVSQLESVAYPGRVAEQVRGELTIYVSALSRAESILSSIVRLGIEDRLVRLTEHQASVLATTFSAIMRELGVPEETWQPIVSAHLRLIA
jgi:hypothetical protein